MSARTYRVGPRQRARGRGSSRIDWDRLGRIALVLVLFLILASYVSPLVNFIDAWKDSRGEREQVEILRSENGDLKRRIAALDDPAAAEREARELGMVAEGERSYVIRGLPK